VWVDLALGGLNYQIEHHLFPSMPRPHLRHAQPLVRDFCVGRGIPYYECGLLRSYGEVFAPVCTPSAHRCAPQQDKASTSSHSQETAPPPGEPLTFCSSTAETA